MAGKDGGQGPKKIPWLFRPIGDGKPWPFAKRLRVMGWLCIAASALFLFLLILFLQGGFMFDDSPEFAAFRLGFGLGTTFDAAWFAAIGVASLLLAAKGTRARRLALKALCVGTIACSVALCVLVYFVDRHQVMFGLLGFAYPPIILNWMKKNREV